MKFQLTRSRGARHAYAWVLMDRIAISTHALTWSATLTKILKNLQEPFQLTRSRGARQAGTPVTGDLTAFQLTRSRGARQCIICFYS